MGSNASSLARCFHGDKKIAILASDISVGSL